MLDCSLVGAKARRSSGGLLVAGERPYIRLRDGRALDRRNITTHRFKPLLKRAGLPHLRFHYLQHTCATLLLSKNVNPKIVSEMLGYATLAITPDTYSHVLPNMQSEAARALDDALS